MAWSMLAYPVSVKKLKDTGAKAKKVVVALI